MEVGHKAKVMGQLHLELPAKENRPSRQASLTVRSAALTLMPPRNHLTTLRVEAFSALIRCVRWYSYRWLIERYH